MPRAQLLGASSCPGRCCAIRYLLITDDASPEDIREAITNLRAKQQACSMGEIREDISADIDELLDLLAERP